MPDDVLHSVGEKTFLQLEKEKNDTQSKEDDNPDDLKSELLGPPEKSLETNSGSKESPRQSSRTRVSQTLYLGQITYGTTTKSSRPPNAPKQPNKTFNSREAPLNFARFTNTRIPQSHIHMVQTLRMLVANVDNKGDDEPDTLKQAIRYSDWPKWKEAMQAKYDSLMENET